MGSHRRYKPRDFDFGHLLVTLRKRTDLTQEEIAVKVGVAVRSSRNWEGGSHYPSDIHMQKLIALCLDKNVFARGQEHEEARLLWDQLRESSHLRIGSFDEQWFAALLEEWQAHSTSQAHQAAGSQQSWSGKTKPLALFAALETEYRGSSSSHPATRLLRGDWSEALDVSSWYGRTDELAEL